MQLIVQPSGTVHCLYGEELDLPQLGSLTIARGSHVEPTAAGQWTADMFPVHGPISGTIYQPQSRTDGGTSVARNPLATPGPLVAGLFRRCPNVGAVILSPLQSGAAFPLSFWSKRYDANAT